MEAIQEVLHSLSGIGEAKGRDNHLTGFIAYSGMGWGSAPNMYTRRRTPSVTLSFDPMIPFR